MVDGLAMGNTNITLSLAFQESIISNHLKVFKAGIANLA